MKHYKNLTTKQLVEILKNVYELGNRNDIEEVERELGNRGYSTEIINEMVDNFL